MLESTTLQLLVFPFGVLYLVLHAGPLFRFFYEPSIRGGTRWRFFGSEVLLFSAYLLCAPALWHSTLGRVVMAAHLTMHVAFTITDYVAHEFLLSSALTQRAKQPLMWAAKEFGLVVDTATHAIAVGIVAQAIGLPLALVLSVPAFGAFAWVTRGYLRDYGPVAAPEN